RPDFPTTLSANAATGSVQQIQTGPKQLQLAADRQQLRRPIRGGTDTLDVSAEVRMTASPDRCSAAGTSRRPLLDAEPRRTCHTFFGWLIQGALFSLGEAAIEAIYLSWVPWSERPQKMSRLRHLLNSSQLTPLVRPWRRRTKALVAGCVAGGRRYAAVVRHWLQEHNALANGAGVDQNLA